MTRAEFSAQAAYLASRSASWAGECVSLTERAGEQMRDESVSRFVQMLRETADLIEKIHVESAGASHDGERK